MAAMRAGDGEGVAAAIREDIEQGIAQVRETLLSALNFDQIAGHTLTV